MSKIFEFMKPYAGMLLCIVALLSVEATCALVLPGYMADIVNDGVLPGHIPTILRNGIIMLLITLLSMAVALAAGFFTARTATGVANDLREAVFHKVIHFSNAEINRFAASSLITRTTNDIMQVQNTMMMAIRQFIYAPIIGVGGVIRALDRNVSMAWIVALATAVMLGLCAILFIIALPKFKAWQKLIDRLNLVTRENLSGILVVRAFSTQKFEKKRFAQANKELAGTELFVNKTFAFMTPIIALVMNITTALIVWVGAHYVSAFRIDIGDIFAFLQYGMLVIFAFLMIAIMFIMVPRAVVCAERIKEVLETKSSIRYRKDPQPLPEDFKGIIEFRNVSFRYPDTTAGDGNVLNNISFTAKPGKTTAIVGSTGCGKTTLLSLLLRFYDVNSGAIYVDGMDIRDIRKEELHGKIGYVPQKASLFSGTIRSNLLYAVTAAERTLVSEGSPSARSATDEKILEAVEIAQAEAFIQKKPGGYESNVAQGGSNFSGGQKQRLSIARALVKNAPIYLFDDSFSALDLKTDALLRSALKKKMGGKTKLIVAQRITTIMDADQIVVLDNGKISGLGTHSELMKTCEVYKEIAASQLNEEEAAL